MRGLFTRPRELANSRPKGEGELGACEALLNEIDDPDLSYDPTGAWVRLESTQTFVGPPTKIGGTAADASFPWWPSDEHR